ncbi:hypothetical protein [Streptomyces lomondensis]|uniref:Uncharacterized protein n=1 Tax=Streptomyces lomondensis TaxID=68229 RepID=A0ABQ2XED8_9ACTN|nr:hypothetical protein [Streptomyces lomondensis]MCF0077664.1 hypothetical protein [Streptomyces lomondensis]GGX13453.1 hypothetical protein GCM10010383_49380 [Streptomyces lomondensis]
MSRTRAAWAAIGTAALLLTGMPAAHAAEAAEAAEGQAPDVRWANSVSDDLGTLQVGISSDSAITGIRAHIVSAATQQEVAVVENDAFTLASGTADDGVWKTKQPLDLPALGSYDIRIEATDADGDRTVDNSAGTLAYYVAAVFEDVRPDRTEIDTDHREVRVDGTLKGRWPGTRELKPLADHRVDLDVDYWTENTVRTDAEGHFSGTVTVNDAVPVQAVYRHDSANPYVLYGESAPTRIGVRQVATRWTFQSPAEARTIDYGQQVTVTATLERETPQGWVPFEGQSGGVLYEASQGTHWAGVGYFTTGEDGKVTFTHTPSETGTFRAASHSDDPFIAPASANSPEITVLRASAFTSFSATRTPDRGVHVEGAMDFPDGWTPGTIPVHIQHSHDGKRWTTLRTTEADWSGEGYAFSADIADGRRGHYRAQFKATDVFRGATSEVVEVGR